MVTDSAILPAELSRDRVQVAFNAAFIRTGKSFSHGLDALVIAHRKFQSGELSRQAMAYALCELQQDGATLVDLAVMSRAISPSERSSRLQVLNEALQHVLQSFSDLDVAKGTKELLTTEKVSAILQSSRNLLDCVPVEDKADEERSLAWLEAKRLDDARLMPPAGVAAEFVPAVLAPESRESVSELVPGWIESMSQALNEQPTSRHASGLGPASSHVAVQ